MRMRFYLWDDYKVERMRRPDRPKGKGGENWEPDPMPIKIGFWANYKWRLFSVFLTGLFSAVALRVLFHHREALFTFGAGAVLYFFLCGLGFMSVFAFPIRWYQEYVAVLEAAGD